MAWIIKLQRERIARQRRTNKKQYKGADNRKNYF